MVENQLRFKRESRRDSERLGGGWELCGQGWEQWEGWELWEGWEGWEWWDSPRLIYSAIADNPEGGQAGKGVRAARAEMGAVRGMGAVAEKLGGTRG